MQRKAQAKRKSPTGEQPGRASKSPKAASQKTTKAITQRPLSRLAAPPPNEPEWALDDRIWRAFRPGCQCRIRLACAVELSAAGFGRNVIFVCGADEVLVAVVQLNGPNAFTRRYMRALTRDFTALDKRGERLFAALFDRLRDDRVCGVDEGRDAIRRAEEAVYAAEREEARSRRC